jgi:Sulfotransferase domain
MNDKDSDRLNNALGDAGKSMNDGLNTPIDRKKDRVQKIKFKLNEIAGFGHSSAVSCLASDAVRYPRQWELKRTALVSYPRSGNSWTRNLLQKASGYLTTSIYHDISLARNMPGELFDDDSFLIKTHFPFFADCGGQSFEDLVIPASQLKYYDQAVYLVRNPFDALLSYHQYQMTNNSHAMKIEIEEGSLSIATMEPLVQWYKLFYMFWEKVTMPYLVLKYEEMREKPFENLERLIDFIVPPPKAALSPRGILFLSRLFLI